MDNVIYTDEAGYNAYKNKLKELKEELSKIKLERADAFNASAGDGWDTPEFEENERLVFGISCQIEQLENLIKNLVIINPSENKDNIVDIGNYVEVTITNNEEVFTKIFKIVAFSPNILADIREVSINSPLGACVYKHYLGEELSYSVNGNQFFVKIINIQSQKNTPLEEIGPSK